MGKTSKTDTNEKYLSGIVEAINRSNAVIEFELDGTISTANEKFLAVMGYELDEIVGKHHSIFTTKEIAESDEYKNFWDSLRKGEFQAAEYKRLGKGGKEVWIQATYNPILGDDGTPVKVIKFATDITEDSLRKADFAGQVEAINKSQAVIEFDMSGRILNANKNFLSIMGYRLDEILGKHHSMFAEPGYSESQEYKDFWTSLGKGNYQASEYKRIGKGGREVWIQASYNPIFNREGDPWKVVKFATDITERKETDALIQKQQQLLLELSTPTMQLFKGVVLMPLVGNIDGDRATQLITNLLEAIAEHQAEVAILDVTGVPVIDTDVARNILKAVSASKMLGSQVIITGMKPTGAQTLVQLGIDLSHITTKGTLRAGIEEALRVQGMGMANVNT